MGQSATTCLSYQLVSSMGIAGLEMTPEPARLPSNGLLMDDVETDSSGDGDIVLPQEPPALEDVSSV